MSKCTRILTGSTSKGRNGYYYYYHCGNSCGTRFKANVVNDAFLEELKKLQPKPGLEELCALTRETLYDNEYKVRGSNASNILSEIESLNEKVSKARNLLLNDQIDGKDYRTIKLECEQRITSLESKLGNTPKSSVKIGEELKKAVHKLLMLEMMYKNGDIKIKREIIGSIYPEKLCFDGKEHRTTCMNEAVSLMYLINNKLAVKNTRASNEKSRLPVEVGHDGLEPSTKRINLHHPL